MARRRWLIVVVVALVAAIVTYGILYLNRGRTQADALPEDADGVAHVDEAVVYDELGHMTEEADLIVEGWGPRVSGSRTGGHPAGEASHRRRSRLAPMDEADRR